MKKSIVKILFKINQRLVFNSPNEKDFRKCKQRFTRIIIFSHKNSRDVSQIYCFCLIFLDFSVICAKMVNHIYSNIPFLQILVFLVTIIYFLAYCTKPFFFFLHKLQVEKRKKSRVLRLFSHFHERFVTAFEALRSL